MLNHLMASNGIIYASWKSDYTLGNLTFPHVGLHEHARDPWRFGVWAAGEFAWSGDFERKLSYIDDTLVTDVTLTSEKLGVRLQCNDAVHFRQPVLLKKVNVTNTREVGMELRLFFHHDPYIKESSDSNTVYFCPDTNSLVAYKEDIYVMANAQIGDQVGFWKYCCGHKKSRGLVGTWSDAEDGELGGCAIAEGSVDSVGAVHFYLAPGETKTVWYWMSFGTKYRQVKALDDMVRKEGPTSLLAGTESYWRYWVRKPLGDVSSAERCFSYSPASSRTDCAEGRFADLGEPLAALYRRSVLTVRGLSDSGGAVIAACDSNIRQFNSGTYGSCWPRDASIVVGSADVAGHDEISRKFFAWAARTITDGGYFLHKYTPTSPGGMLAASWHPFVDSNGAKLLPIQEDETALPLIALWKHYLINRNTEFIYESEDELYTRLVVPAGKFMQAFRDEKTGLPKPSFDLWEERFGVSAFTVPTVYAGLKAASRLSRPVDAELCESFDKTADSIRDAFLKHFYNESLGRFVRRVTVNPDGSLVQDAVIDSCMFAIWYFGLLPADDPKVVRTMEAIESRLWSKGPVGGIIRYENDTYHGPENPWIICTLWVAQWHIAKAKSLADLTRARELMDWVLKQANVAMLLPEQVDPKTGEALSVSPLTWSHATVILAVSEYCAKYDELRAAAPAVSSTPVEAVMPAVPTGNMMPAVAVEVPSSASTGNMMPAVGWRFPPPHRRGT